MNAAIQSFATAPAVLLVHIASMFGAVLLGAWMLWARKGSINHKRLGWIWIALMGVAALSSIVIAPTRTTLGVTGLSPIHVLTLVTAVSLFGAIWFIRRGNVQGHKRTMQNLYIGACLVAGAFTLLPGRFLGDMLWHQLLGLPV